uniref:ORF76b n=1 Tax=Pinus koraiensis TaxID=88728 RepID=A4QMI9_PINKO|nr:ORF76b [Pinus koraiensis]ABP35398.1 ORF76b [Pinus koraiensis]
MCSYIVFNASTYFLIFSEIFGIIPLLCEPMGTIILGYTKSKTKWIYFLRHTYPFFRDSIDIIGSFDLDISSDTIVI